jgi:hypothetical protein
MNQDQDQDTRGYATGSLRVSDADRDRALAELSEHFQAGRLTTEEFDERSGQALTARTGSDLAVLLADLPPTAQSVASAPPAAVPAAGQAPRRRGVPVMWIVIAVALVAGVVSAVVGTATKGHVRIELVPWWLIPVAIFVLRRRAIMNGGRSRTRWPGDRQ